MKFIYEERIVEYPNSVVDKLNEWGADGWECIQTEENKKYKQIPMGAGVNAVETIWYTSILLKKCIA